MHKKIKSLTLNYPTDIPTKYVFCLTEPLFSPFCQNTLKAFPNQSNRSCILKFHMCVIFGK